VEWLADRAYYRDYLLGNTEFHTAVEKNAATLALIRGCGSLVAVDLANTAVKQTLEKRLPIQIGKIQDRNYRNEKAQQEDLCLTRSGKTLSGTSTHRHSSQQFVLTGDAQVVT
jgi:hypothetical protein